jgi:hypothetical protein
VTAAHAKVLKDISIAATLLQGLQLRRIRVLDESETFFEDILRSNPSLKSCEIKRCFFSDDALCYFINTLVKSNPTLQELSINANYCHDLSLRAIANCLQQGNMVNLSIDESSSSFREELENLVGEGPRLCGRDFNVLANAVKPGNSLRKLTLRCNLSNPQVEGLLDTLLRCPTIEELDLSHNQAPQLTFEGISLDSLAHDVQSCSLRWLILSWVQLREAEPLFRILSLCPKLEKLDLSHNQLEQLDFGTSFSKPSAGSLRKLCLVENPFGGEERDNHKIEKEILEVLQANPLLCDLTYTTMGEDPPDNIQHCMDMNWAGRVLLGNQDVPFSLWPVVIERVNENKDWPLARKANAIFGLLRLLDVVHENTEKEENAHGEYTGR